LGFAGKKSEPFLRKGIEDSDSYVRRRAILSLAKLQPEDARLIAEKFIENADPYIRQAALEMAYASRDTDFITKTKNKLLHDSVGHVRKAAARRLE
jgi:HEAT repeat protein